MKKILSICVPSYNMENYLNRCIDSLIAPEIIDDLEIIIVNDGSKDRTLEIANSYKEKYPQSVVVIDKPNGHYGSCINASLKVATGKYYRVLDADDWFDTKSLVEVVKIMSRIDAECVFTNFVIHNMKQNRIEKQLDKGMRYNETLSLNEYIIPENCLSMHSLSYRLDLLKRIHYKQTEGICYTDSEYVFYPLLYAHTLYALECSLYQYFVGRDDQSMSNIQIQKNKAHFLKILCYLVRTKPSTDDNKNASNIRATYFVRIMNYVLFSYLIMSVSEQRDLCLIKKIIEEIKKISSESFDKIMDYNIKGIYFVRPWLQNKISGKAKVLFLRCLYRLKYHL